MSVEYIEVGRVCVSRAGHDKGALYVVHETLADGYVMLVDGTRRPLNNPKKKKVKHIKGTPYVLDGLAEKFSGKKIAFDFEIAKALDEIRQDITMKGKEG
ncbi:MAG: RNA-binding protein [Christensenellales bacterium]|jgi:large subunit ribosomal protein L14e